jgi:hypothetical protein
LNRIKRDVVLRKKIKTLSVFIKNTQAQTTSQHRELICLPKQYISRFLFGISAGRIEEPKLQAEVIQFQEEAHLFLVDALPAADVDQADLFCTHPGAGDRTGDHKGCPHMVIRAW